jgi:CO/xanthine dehydrogenase Mo-binding subunit
VSPFVGGAFGSKSAMTPRTAMVALAAKRLKETVDPITKLNFVMRRSSRSTARISGRRRNNSTGAPGRRRSGRAGNFAGPRMAPAMSAT